MNIVILYHIILIYLIYFLQEIYKIFQYIYSITISSIQLIVAYFTVQHIIL